MTDHVCDDIHFNLNIQWFGDTNLKYLEVSGVCKGCGRKLAFRGPAGLNPSHPTAAMDGAEAIFPFVMEGEEYDGKAVGYALTFPGAN